MDDISLTSANFSLAKFETTAAEAQFSAPNTAVAQQIEVNAESMEKVAEQAAAAAAVCELLHYLMTLLKVMHALR